LNDVPSINTDITLLSLIVLRCPITAEFIIAMKNPKYVIIMIVNTNLAGVKMNIGMRNDKTAAIKVIMITVILIGSIAKYFIAISYEIT
jgi:hypothetical protein